MKLFKLIFPLIIFSFFGQLQSMAKNKDAEKFFNAAQQGSPAAQFMLGYFYEKGLSGVQQDYSEAEKWYQKAADQEYEDAQDALKELKKLQQRMKLKNES